MLEQMDLDVAAWVETVKGFGRIYHRVAGKEQSLRGTRGCMAGAGWPGCLPCGGGGVMGKSGGMLREIPPKCRQFPVTDGASGGIAEKCKRQSR